MKKISFINCEINSLFSFLDYGKLVTIIHQKTHVSFNAIIKGENRIQRFTKIEAGQVVETRTYK